MVRRKIRRIFHGSFRPANLELVDLCCTSGSEVQPQITLRCITSTGSHLSHLNNFAGCDLHARPDFERAVPGINEVKRNLALVIGVAARRRSSGRAFAVIVNRIGIRKILPTARITSVSKCSAFRAGSRALSDDEEVCYI
jgi:hypothetical protein